MSKPADISLLLDQNAPIDRAAAEDRRMDLAAVPAKAAVYLLEGEGGEAILLATVGDLRAALRRRLADTAADTRSKRVEYAKISARLRYRLVHSPFAANWYYLQAARAIFPGAYRRMISWRPTHFLAISPVDTHPRLVRTEELSDLRAVFIGPIAQRRAADKLIETLQDLFDLCRYHHILVQAPHGKACAYKEMGKCPAPCDGSITMGQYRTQIEAALAFVTSPEDAVNARVGYTRWRADVETAMKAAAGTLDFEKAGRLKQALARGRLVETEPFARMDLVSRFAYLALQPGQGKPYVEPFLIHGGTITPLEQIKRRDLAQGCAALFERCKELAAIPVRTPLLAEQTETISLVAHHLFRGVEDAGIYLPLRYTVDAAAIEKAATELLVRRNLPKPMAEQSSDREVKEEPSAATPEAPGAADADGE